MPVIILRDEGGRQLAIRIADLPEPEQPRKRLVRVGPGGLSDRELLALVIRTGGRGTNAVDLGANLISEWRSTAALGAARFEDFLHVEGLGEAKAASLMAAFELGRRAITVCENASTINSPADLVVLVRPLLLGKPHEEVVLAVMNSSNRPIRTISLSSGGADRCLLTVRDALSAVLRNDGVAFGLAHNHPSGDPTPSSEDIVATKEIEAGAIGLGLRFLDHVIIAGAANWSSMKETGLVEA